MNDATAPRVQGSVLGEVPRRVLSSAVLVPLALGAAYFGRPYFTLLILAGALLLALEWATVCGGRGELRIAAQLLFPAVALSVAPALGIVGATAAIGLLGLGAAVVLAAAIATKHPDPVWLAAGVLYIGAPALALIWLRADTDAGRAFILWLFGVVWATDIGAYFSGRLIGGPLLAPRISPKKTWAGLFGGVGAACVLTVLVAASGEASYDLVWVAACLAVAAVAGDLLESGIKRRFGVKDMGRLIPGHGGLFDRVDGLLLAAPAAALLLTIFGGTISPWH